MKRKRIIFRDGLPARRTQRKYPFDLLEIGKAFHAPEPAYKVRACAYAYARKHPGTRFKVQADELGAWCLRLA